MIIPREYKIILGIGLLTLVTATAGLVRAPVRFGSMRLVFIHALGQNARITVGAGDDLQAAVNAAQSGDTLVLDAAASFTGPIVLPVKSGSTPVTITTSATLPSRRITPADAALLPDILVPNAERAIKTVAGAHDYSLIGLEVRPVSEAVTVYAMIELGSGGADQNSFSQVPQRFLLDRMYIHGFPTADSQRGIALNSGETTISNCYISDIHGRGYDTQAIGGWNGPGPYRIINNYLEAAGENVMFGGSLASIPNLIPSGIEFRGNHVFKPLSWKKGDPSFVPLPTAFDHWSVKNLFELKNAANVVIDSNIFENSWTDAQAGFALVFTVRGEGANQMPWATLRNIRVTNNIIRNVDQGIQTLGIDYANASTPADGLFVYGNLFENVRNWFFVLNSYNNVTIEHNTHTQNGNVMVFTGAKSTNFIYRNNVTARSPSGYGFKADNGGEGTSALEQYTSGYVFEGNVVAAAPASIYPVNNSYPADLSNLSQYKGTDGLVPGYGGVVVTPTPTPTPTSTPTPTPIPLPSPSATPVPSPSPTATPTPTPTPVPSPSPSPSPSKKCRAWPPWKLVYCL